MNRAALVVLILVVSVERAPTHGDTLTSALGAAGLVASEPIAPLLPRPDVDPLEEAPQPLVAAHPRDESGALRLEALSRFATARRAEQRDDYDTALRWYQRAFRSDPKSAAAVRRIVLLSASLGRGDVALRYAAKGVDLGLSDPIVMRQLAVQATERGAFDEALKLYEQANSADRAARRTALGVMTAAEMGRLYYLTDRFPEAAKSFEVVVEAIDKPEKYGLEDAFRRRLLREPRISFELFGEAYLKAGRYDDARKAFRRSVSASPELVGGQVAPVAAALDPRLVGALLAADGRMALYEAMTLNGEGKPELALASLERFLRSPEPADDSEPFELLKKLLDAGGKSAELTARLSDYEKSHPKNSAAVRFAATQRQLAGDRSEAERLWRQAQQMEPTGDGYRALAELLRQNRDIEGLIRLSGDVVERAGSLAPLGEAADAIAKDDTLLAALIDRARAWQQERNEGLSPNAALALGTLALQGDRIEAAGEFFKLALSEKPLSREDKQRQAAIRQVWGLGLLRADRWAEAVGVLQPIIDDKLTATGDETSYRFLAIALDQAGRTDDALKLLEPRIRRSPELALQYAELLNAAGRSQEAMTRFKATLKRADERHDDPGLRENLRRARMQLSNIAVGLGQMDEAEEWLEQVLDEFPDDIGAANDLGYLWADANKRLGQALEMGQRAVAAEPDNAAYRDTLGWALYRLGRYGEAATELDKAVSLLKQPDGVVLDHLGDARMALGNSEAARVAWRQAAEALEKTEKPDTISKQRLAGVQEKLRRHDAAVGQAPAP